MEARELDIIIAQRLPSWFEVGESFSGAEVFALLTDEESLPVSPDDVYDALERLAGREGSLVRRLRSQHTPRWARLYTLEAPQPQG